MIHRRRKVDANQKIIIAALRAIGACVIDLSGSGGGVMDLLVIYRGRANMIEVKNMKGRGKVLTPAQIELHALIGAAGGEVHVVCSVDDAIAVVTR